MKRKIIYFAETDSTSNRLRDYEPQEGEEMTVAVADFQTAGRGNGGNKWVSERGKNLLFSILVHPKHVPPRRQFLLSEAEALAVCDALNTYAEGFRLKWPNDVYWNDSKISGTIIETSINGEGVTRCVYGTGINVNQREFPSEAPNPVSLCQIVGHDVGREELLSKVLDGVDRYLEMLRENRFQDLSQLYHTMLYHADGVHRYRDKQGEFKAAIVEVEDDGHLILRDEQWRMRSYAFKEVEFII